MSDSNFSVDADAMGPAVEGLKSLGDRLGQITQNLESKLDNLGKPWGDDKNGHNFFQQYGKSRDQVLTGMASMTDATHGVATGINTMIKGYNNINDHAKETARNLGSYDGSGGYTGGGGGGDGYGSYGDGSTQGTPMLRREMASERLAPMERARRMDALMPETRGVPATDENGQPLEPVEGTLRREAEPLQPLQRGELREGTLLPTERAEPLRPMEGVPAQFEPALPADRGVEPLRPMERLLPMEGTTEGMPMGRLMPAERGVPAEPVQLTPEHMGTPMLRDNGVPAHELLPMEGRVTEGVPAQPLQPEHVALARHEVMPLQPAEGRVAYPTQQDMPVESPRLYDRIPAEPLQPAHAFERVQAEPLQPMHAFERVQAEPLQPTHAFERVQAEPLQPTHVFARTEEMPAQPMIPAEPAHFERVHEDTPVEQPREFVRSEAPLEPRLYERGVPAEPQGFAELEPERYSPMLPETPAEPAQ